MDPDVCLQRALEIMRGIVDADPDNVDANDLREIAMQGCLLAEYLHNLDEWILKGGFLPERWRTDGR
jgi:hypothetical protein